MKVKYTTYYEDWFNRIKDSKIKTTIIRRIDRIRYSDHLGDYKVLETNLYELRFFIHSGIRIYFTLKGDELIILLIGGDKDTQTKDISKAREILKELNNG
ncbi:type II toxin-antitoxin system RelE/ParE family toxin [Campylobacter sp.]|uniref:type II toxin-antitoxin system RelE/ParE family toxin n=1 Tax=Campylobacter sp. TaxID=205 RepID=UPI002906EF38|nr:type II toxin-antitoxin system RelE/ParE family toxin [Campylobacter sp.]MDU6827827.1 type II toxin-antitoxin system RelE/ParE family toxin [Campylobacter sp.]